MTILYLMEEKGSLQGLLYIWSGNMELSLYKEIKTKHIYELLELFRGEGYKDATLKGYISAFRQAYKWHMHLFSEEFEMPSNAGFEEWAKNRNV